MTEEVYIREVVCPGIFSSDWRGKVQFEFDVKSTLCEICLANYLEHREKTLA